MADVGRATSHILSVLEAELPANLYYHGLWHTNAVIHSAQELCNHYALSSEECEILNTAAAYHDCGFLRTYKDHEEAGCTLTAQILPDFGYSEEQITAIQGLIMATKIPQSPHNFLEELICDADLDYLGGNDYARIANLLFEELKDRDILTSEEKWMEMQISFLESHQFFSFYSREKNNAGKIQNLLFVKQQKTQL